MRAPIFLRFREDKKPPECTIEDERHVDEVVVTILILILILILQKISIEWHLSKKPLE